MFFFPCKIELELELFNFDGIELLRWQIELYKFEFEFDSSLMKKFTKLTLKVNFSKLSASPACQPGQPMREEGLRGREAVAFVFCVL